MPLLDPKGLQNIRQKIAGCLSLVLEGRINTYEQCCESGSAWFPHNFGKLDPDPHQSEKVEALEVVLWN
jgi:hypothetical protein